MLNWIWLGLILAAVLTATANGKLADLPTAAFDAAKNAVLNLAIPLAGLMALWLGMMRLAERAGLVSALARFLQPALRRLFPDVPPGHPALGSMVMNIAANMLGLANAATPLGLRAMRDLQSLNPHPTTATNAMCTFLAINTSSVQIIPATAVAILAASGSTRPTAIIGTALFATCCSTLAGLLSVKLLERLPAYRPPIVPNETSPTSSQNQTSLQNPQSRTSEPPTPTEYPLFSLPAIICLSLLTLAFLGFAIYLTVFNPSKSPNQGNILINLLEAISLLAIPFVFTFFPTAAALKKVPVYEEFVEGAREGFQVAVGIIPYLVAILAAVGMFRTAGGIDALTSLLGATLAKVGIPAELLPLMLIRPLSGSGAVGLFTELAKTHGPDSLLARMGATILGSTETTFYVIAVYFGSVGIRRTRHAVPAGLIADLAGMLSAIAICRLYFG
ncbi:MAG: spore maturation protein [Chthoniobacterales bacterium]|nr:spore maturation protein [Chthoniobacterales bacterium]